MEENTTIINETTEQENFFSQITGAFQYIIDLILSIVNMIRDGIESITGKK